MQVRAVDGVRLHAEVFGPEDGRPMVRWPTASPAPSGSGPIRSPIWPPTTASSPTTTAGTVAATLPAGAISYSLNHLAADLDAVLDATLKPGERALIAGHSMGGIAITSWSQRYPAGWLPAPTPSR